MYYTTSVGAQLCQMSKCSDDTTMIPSIIPNIHFTYETVSPDDPAFQQTPPDLICAPGDTEECPTPSTLHMSSLISTMIPSTSPQLAPSTTSTTSPYPTATVFVIQQDNKGVFPLSAIIVSAVLVGVLLLAIGGLFIVSMVLSFKKK